MSSSTTKWIPLEENTRMQAQDAILESIITKLDGILTDSLKSPRPPKKDLWEFRKVLRKGYRHEFTNTIAGMPADDVSEATLVSAYEPAVHDCAASLASWANDIAGRVAGDVRITDPQLKEQIAKEVAAVAAGARTLMADIKL